MDDAKKLIHWAINLPDQYKPKITSFDWPKRIGYDLFDYSFNFEHKNIEYHGRGSSEKIETAFVKAIIECIERTAIDKNRLKSSNGVAAHFDKAQAKENAICELIERDIFLCNYLSPSSGVTEIDSTDLSEQQTRTIKSFCQKHVAIRLYELGTVLNRTVVLALANGFNCSSPFGCIIGLGSNRSKQQALNTAISEATRNIATNLDSDICVEWSLSENSFFKDLNESFSILEHGRIALTEEYGRWIWKYFEEKKKFAVKTNDSIQESEITFSDLEVDDIFRDLGVKLVHAKSESMQNLFFHKTELHKINKDRLCRYMGTPFYFDSLNLRPHPLA